MKIKFNNLEDFVHEIEKDKDKIERGIMRVNIVTAMTKFSPNIREAFVLAGCIVADHILEYREFCGELWGHGFECDEKTRGKVKSLRDQLDAELARLGIADIRGGTIEEAEAKA